LSDINLKGNQKEQLQSNLLWFCRVEYLKGKAAYHIKTNVHHTPSNDKTSHNSDQLS